LFHPTGLADIARCVNWLGKKNKKAGGGCAGPISEKAD
jgi:hypothetical protein